MIRKPIHLLNDIIENIKDIYVFTEKMNLDDFQEDSKTSKAVLRSFEIIGECVKNLPIETKDNYPYISWKQIGSMRDRLIHEYFGVDYSIVWQSIEEDLPLLEQVINEIIDNTKV
jgi:uncharacterized protein with HEPN domain